ncbi:MAG: DnaB-like helicase C-terminal domain-containing protein [Myxococcota bacterium]
MTPTSAVVPFPRRPASQQQLELDLLGGALHLASRGAITAKTWMLIGLSGDEFTAELVQKAWKICRKQAEMGRPVSALTVFTAGFRARWFTDGDGPECDLQRLIDLADANRLSLEQWREAALDFRLHAQGLRIAASLEAEAQRIRSVAFDPSAVAGRLAGLERELHANAARITDLTEDQVALNERWARNRATGRKDTVATGIKVLDAEIGGLPRLLCVIAADAGVGKTALIDSMVHAMLEEHPDPFRVGLISPEDGVEHVVRRWLARDTGFMLRDVGSRELSPQEEELVQEKNAAHYPLLQRVLGYRERQIKADDLITLCWQMVDHGAGAIFIDNFNKIDIQGGPEYARNVQRFSDRLSEFAEKARVPAVLVVHMTDGETNIRGKVTASGGLQGGKAIGRDARFRIDLFRKGKELRGVIAKANELCEQGTVVQFTRFATAGLIDPANGEKIDVAAERAAERALLAAQREAEIEKRRQKREAERAAKKAEAEAKKAEARAGTTPQLELGAKP